MNTKRIIGNYWIKSSILTIMQRLSVVFFGMGSYLILVRIMNKEEIGTWALFLGISTTFELTKTALLKNGIITFYHSTNKKSEVLSSGLLLNFAYSIISIILILLVGELIARYLKSEELSTMLRIYIISILLLVYFSHFEYIQQSNLSFIGSFVSYTIRQGTFFLLILITFILNRRTTVIELVYFQNISLLLAVLTSFFLTRRFLNYKFFPRKKMIKDIFNYGKYIFTSGVLSNIFGNLDRYMIAGMINNTFVAYYDLSARINNMIDVPTSALADVLFPKSVIAERKEGKEKVKDLFEATTAGLVAMLIPISILIIVSNKIIIKILAGNNYIQASSIIIVSMLYAFLRPIQNQACNVLNSINRPYITFRINLIILILNIFFDYIFIRIFGYTGAAIGSLLVTVIGTNIATWALHRYTGVNIFNIFNKSFSLYKNLILFKTLNFNKA